MTPESESEDFKQLRRLLALKRHEVPPPGYFNNFSREVISRIRASRDTRRNISWIQRLQQALEFRPAFAGAFGLAVCALLTGGILYSANMDVQTMASNPLNNGLPNLPITASVTPVSGNPMDLPPGSSLSGAPASSGLFDPMQVQPIYTAVRLNPDGQ